MADINVDNTARAPKVAPKNAKESIYDKFNAIDMLMGRKERILMNFENQLEAIERKLNQMRLEKSAYGVDFFKNMVDKWRHECGQLRSSTTKIVLFGNRGVGKSSLSNHLVGFQLFATSKMPMTSTVTVLKSGVLNFRKTGITSATVTLSPFLTSEEDVDEYISLWLQRLTGQDEVDKLLQTQNILKELIREKGYLQGRDAQEKLRQILLLPDILRNDPPITRIEAQGELFGIDKPGIQLCDCPGTKEAPIFTAMTRMEAITASVLIFVCDLDTGITDADEDITFLRNQLSMGTRVVVVLNTWKQTHGAELSAEDRAAFNKKKADILNALQAKKRNRETGIQLAGSVTAHIVCINPTELVYSNEMLQLLDDISDALYTHMRSVLAMFLRTMHNIAIVYFNYSTRTISLHCRSVRMSHNLPVEPIERIDVDVRKVIEMINQLKSEAQAKLRAMSNEFDNKYLELIEKFDKIYRESLENLEVRSVFLPWQPNWISRLFIQPPPELEKYKEELLIHFEKSLSNFLTERIQRYQFEKNTEFATWIATKAHAITKQISELQNAQLELTTGNHKSKENNFANLFKAVDDGIDSLHIKPSELVAMVGTGGAVAAGAAVAGIAIAALTALVIAGIGGIALAGGWLFYFAIKANASQTETEFREKIFNEFIAACKERTNRYEQFKASMIGDWQGYLQQLINTLTASISNMDNIAKLSNVLLSDKILESFLWIREEILKTELELRDELRFLGTKETFTPLVAVRNDVKSLMGTCFACLEPISKCDHLCRACDAILGASQKCPFCKAPNAERINSMWLRVKATHQALISSVIESLEVYEPDDFVPTESDLKPILKKPNQLFAKWFNKTDDLGSPGNVVTHYIVTATQKLTAGKQSASLERLLQKTIWSELFPLIKSRFQLHFNEEAKYLEHKWLKRCNNFDLHLVEKFPHEVFDEFVNNWNEAITPWDKAHCFRRLNHSLRRKVKPGCVLGADEMYPVWEYACICVKDNFVADGLAITECSDAVGRHPEDGFLMFLSVVLQELSISSEHELRQAAAAAADREEPVRTNGSTQHM